MIVKTTRLYNGTSVVLLPKDYKILGITRNLKLVYLTDDGRPTWTIESPVSVVIYVVLDGAKVSESARWVGSRGKRHVFVKESS